MRSAYLDEAGISSPQQEPILVIAGVIVHTDRQWAPIHAHFQGLIEHFIPDGEREGVIFHAKDIWHGNRAFDRTRWDKAGKDRREVILAVCKTIEKFQLPVIYGSARRAEVMEALSEDRESFDQDAVTRVAFMGALMDVAFHAQTWMDHYGQDEVLNLVLESNDQYKKYAKAAFKTLKKSAGKADSIFARYAHRPITRIVDAPSSMDKEDAPPLQLADMAAFIIKRWLMGKPDVLPYITILMPWML